MTTSRRADADFLERNDRTASVHFLVQLALIVACGALLAGAQSPWSSVMWTVVLGVLLVFLFPPLHETIHKTAFNTPFLNTLAGWICGFVIFLPAKFFQSFHMAHHRYTQIAGKDPELDGEKPSTLWQYLVYVSGLVYWKEQVVLLIRLAFGRADYHFINDRKRAAVVREGRIFVAIYAAITGISLFTGSTLILELWIFPLLLGQPMLRIFLLAEHTLCPHTGDMFRNTRTTLTNPLMQFLCWNMNYHVEHHAYPAVPFHRLEDLHQRIRLKIETTGAGYLSVNREIIRSLHQPASTAKQ